MPHDHFSIFVSANNRNVSYKYSTSIGWTAGDRVGYGFAYGFLLVGSEPMARFTFHKVEYCQIIDKYMGEGKRYYDGTLNTDPTKRQLYHPGNLPIPDEAYVPHTGDYPTPPIVTFNLDGTDVDVRDYDVPQVGTGSPFQYDFVGDQTSDRVGFVAYQLQADTGQDEPVFSVYYDLLPAASGLTMTVS